MSALTTWQFAPLVVAATAVLAAGYLAGARRLTARARRRPQARPWPRLRVLAFLGGLGVVTVATQGWVGVHDDTSLADHMIQHLLLIMVAPPLLILGRR